jgi:hypothetical protein
MARTPHTRNFFKEFVPHTNEHCIPVQEAELQFFAHTPLLRPFFCTPVGFLQVELVSLLFLLARISTHCTVYGGGGRRYVYYRISDSPYLVKHSFEDQRHYGAAPSF